MNAPERLLYHPYFMKQVVVSLPEGRTGIPHTEYVRADLFAAEKSRADKAEALLAEAVEIINALVDEDCDYMRINNLGDPEKQHNIKRARATLAKITEAKDNG